MTASAAPKATVDKSERDQWRSEVLESYRSRGFMNTAFSSARLAHNSDPANKEVLCYCDFHDDSKPSMSINTELGKYFCQACGQGGDAINYRAHVSGMPWKVIYNLIAQETGVATPESLRKATGDTTGQGKKQRRKGPPLFKSVAKKLGKIVCVYEYRNESNTNEYEIVRFDPKNFRPRITLPNGDIVSQLPRKRILYRLPELISSPPSEPIFIVEGEKDVDNLAAINCIATTAPNGAQAWDKLDNERTFKHFHNRDVIVIPDQDEAGNKHRDTIAKSFVQQCATARLKILHLPDTKRGADISDWIADGGDKKQLLALLEASAKPIDVATLKKSTAKDSLPIITNYKIADWVDDNGHVIKKRIARDIHDIAESILAVMPGWPKLFGADELFIESASHTAEFLTKPPQLFTWLHKHAVIAWDAKKEDAAGRSFVSRQEILHALTSSPKVQRVVEISSTPLFPPRDDIHCLGNWTIEKSKDQCLLEFCDFFRPATPLDFELIYAYVLSHFYSGKGGDKPLFVITGTEANSQQAIGKTTLAEAVGELTGDCFRVNLSSATRGFGDDLNKQLLSDHAMTARSVLFDNLDGYTKSAELAEIITAKSLTGRPSHGRHRTRRNLLTYTATAISPNLDGDLTSRAFVIQLEKPSFDPLWAKRLNEFVAKHRREIVCDALHHLADNSDPTPINPALHSRFTSWDNDVLSCCASPDEILAQQASRKESVDAESEAIVLFIDEILERSGVPGPNQLDSDMLKSPLKTSTASDIWTAVTKTKINATWLGRHLRTLAAKGKLPPGLTIEKKNNRSTIHFDREVLLEGTL